MKFNHVLKENISPEIFTKKFKLADIKGMISPSGYRKLKFFKEGIKYIVQYPDEYKSFSEAEFKSLDSDPELLLNKYMWSEEKETVDGIILYENELVLIYRKYAPKGLALPGGMIDPGEDAKTAFVREMEEELNVDTSKNKFFKTISAQEPRGPIKTHVFICSIVKKPKAGDDADSIRLVNLSEINRLDFAFDHHKNILLEYISINQRSK